LWGREDSFSFLFLFFFFFFCFVCEGRTSKSLHPPCVKYCQIFSLTSFLDVGEGVEVVEETGLEEEGEVNEEEGVGAGEGEEEVCCGE
jgi:hypothetical protein